MTALQALGYQPEARVLIVTCDNLGAYHSANDACYDALDNGAATNASLMVPAPWAREAVRSYRGAHVGVNLTLNAEYPCYRWGPLTHAPTLHGGEGGFPQQVSDLWEHADSEEARRECRAQIERAIVWGFDPTHLSSHLDAMVMRPELFDVYLDLAVEFGLPIGLGRDDLEGEAGFPFRALATEANVLSPDQSIYGSSLPLEALSLHGVKQFLSELAPGVHELVFNPSLDSPEAKAVTSEATRRSQEHLLLTDPGLPSVIGSLGIETTSYSALRQAQRQL